VLVALHNFGSEPREVQLVFGDAVPGSGDGGSTLTDLFTGDEFALERGRGIVPLDGYGYRWLRLDGDDSDRY